MWESRWPRPVGPGVLALGAVLLLASTTSGAPVRAWESPPCRTAPPTIGERPAGSWFRSDPVLQDGRLDGMRLTVGRGTTEAPRHLDLPPESFAAGPFDGLVLVGSDDGQRSTLAMLDLHRWCRMPVGTTTDVIRRATLTPDRTAIVEVHLDRASRENLGVFRRTLRSTGDPVRIVPPIGPDVRFGPTWTTDLAWSTDGRWLAVQSCAERACRTRIVDPDGGIVRAVADPGLADLVGLTGEHLVVHAACGGLPCSLVSVRISDGRTAVLANDAGQAVVTMDADGVAVVVHETWADGRLRVVRPDGTGARDLPAIGGERRLVAGPGRAGGATEVGPGFVLLARDGRPPLDGSPGAVARRLVDGTIVDLEEVIP